MTDLRDAHAKGYISRVPCYNSIFNYFESEVMTPYLKLLIEESSLPLRVIERDFAVDSSGFSTGVYQKWAYAKWDSIRVNHGGKSMSGIKRHDWVKAHIMCGVKTNVITAIEVTHAHANDHDRFQPLVEATSQNFVIDSVSADKAYSSYRNVQYTFSKAAMPYIDFKKNTKVTIKSPAGWKRMFHYYSYNREDFMRQYHKRSNVETTFSMMKAKFGEKVRSKTPVARENEVLCKALCHNIACVIQSTFELGIQPDFWQE